jgi:hypothetical protein
MPPKKSAIAAAASKTGKKKKWSKGKVKDKVCKGACVFVAVG